MTPFIPDSMTFAGEEVPLHRPDIRERLEQEVISNTFFHSRTLGILKETKRWQAEVFPILEKDSVPKDFFYLAVAESGLDNSAGSPAGAKGMWQFLASTARRYDIEISTYIDQRKDPVAATHAAGQHLKHLKAKFGSWTNAAAAYNRGAYGLQQALEGQKVESYYDLYLNSETYRYVFRILAFKLILENPEQYGFVLEASEYYPPLKFTEVAIDSTIADLPQFALDNGTTYKLIRKYNPWIDPNARYTFIVPEGRKYVIRIPEAVK